MEFFFSSEFLGSLYGEEVRLFYLGTPMAFSLCFHTCCLIWMKFCIRNLLIMLLGVSEVYETRRGEHRNFLVDTNGMIFTRARYNRMTFCKQRTPS
jgi:hypothetical protein